MIPKRVSKVCLSSQPLELERSSIVKKLSDFYFDGVSVENVMDSGIQLDEIMDGIFLKGVGRESSVNAVNFGFSPTPSPLMGQVDVSVLGTSAFEVSLNPSVMRASPMMDNFMNVKVSDGFVDCGVSKRYGDETKDMSLHHTISKKFYGKKISKCVCK